MLARLTHAGIYLGGLAWLLVACNGDSSPTDPDQRIPPDAAVDHAVDHTVTDTLRADKAIWEEAQFLTEAHDGWKRTDCLTCHPYSTKDPPPLYKCAGCHGGNGACNPNGASSGKQDHTSAGACTGAGCHDTPIVHPNNTTYTQDTQCQACHFALRGGTPDC